MKYLVDVQGLQTASRSRGIGRYVTGLVHAMIRCKRESDEIYLLLNANDYRSYFDIYDEFSNELPYENFVKFYSPFPNNYSSSVASRDINRNRSAGMLMYETAVLSIRPDIFLIGSPIESPFENFLCCLRKIRQYCIVELIIYDFIIYEHHDEYINSNIEKKYYADRLQDIKNADIWFTISEYTKKHAELFCKGDIKLVNVNCDSSVCFNENKDNDCDFFFKRIEQSKPYIMYAGGSDSRKNVISLVKAYANLPKEIINRFELVLVSGKGKFDDKLFSLISSLNIQKKCKILGFIKDSELKILYQNCSLFVFPSFQEGFGLSVLEAMKCGAPVICSNSTSLPELIAYPKALFDPCNPISICNLMNYYLIHFDELCLLKKHCIERSKYYSWNKTAKTIFNTDVSIIRNKKNVYSEDNFKIYNEVKNKLLVYEEEYNNELSWLIEQQFLRRKRRIYIDITMLNISDSKTGIQRVEKNILKYAKNIISDSYEFYPVYLTEDGYKYATKFISFFKTDNENDNFNLIVEFMPFDILLLPELCCEPYYLNLQRIKLLESINVKCYFILYDLIPITDPSTTDVGIRNNFVNYLDLICSSSGVICDSETILYTFKNWLNNNSKRVRYDFLFEWFHLGADFSSRVYDIKNLSYEENALISKLEKTPTFLVVSTIEPRKGHYQTIKAFEVLWKKSLDVNLVFVGKKGWNVEDLVSYMRNHPELNKHFFWLNGITDELLNAIYSVSSCVIVASIAEGFGLSIVEAAHYNKPLILRELEVFREITHDSATYFSGSEPNDIASCVEKWLHTYNCNKVLGPDGVEVLSWCDSVKMLFDKIL